MEIGSFDSVVPLVDWAIQGYRRYPDFDDIRQEALIRAWQNWSRDTGDCQKSTAVVNAARWGAESFIRSRQCHSDWRRPRPGEAAIRWVPMTPQGTVLIESGDEEIEKPVAVEADFFERLIEQMEQRELLERAFRSMTPRQRQCVRLAMQGYTAAEIGKILGLASPSVSVFISRGVARARAGYQPPPRRPRPSRLSRIPVPGECCGRGHPWDAANTYWHKGGRQCRKCMALNSRNYHARKKAKAQGE